MRIFGASNFNAEGTDKRRSIQVQADNQMLAHVPALLGHVSVFHHLNDIDVGNKKLINVPIGSLKV